ncbi:HoxN/HupN/NixA family nickel/cobalt transporter [Janthinobacterium agaricidamnosum]|uniref:Nickel/cobalt efflux system n=1 Tax=Janthinobacterium agaricidamnosum NBRC 102515 = DSM 9628 TaxID=1349767 RepID=W0V331_9BURK|nr:hypothetical protein [Janthinobacterium agaricidamnosum]CDG83244.1 putative membrane protein [Janthinobacterium agaricidamnosum NBRC 102515 = DSM 9628]
MSLSTSIPSLALIFVLGMRHGLEPDHLAAVDGLTLRTMQTRPRWAPWMGGLFALGHGMVVLAIISIAALVSEEFKPPPLMFTWLEWVPVALLLLIGLMNARALLRPAGYPLAGVRSAMLPSWLRAGAGPLAGIAVGILFALVVDTAVQAAAWGYAAVSLGGIWPALLIGLTFTVGMGSTELLDGWVTARVMRTGRQDVITAFRRRLGWPIVGMCLCVALYMMATRLHLVALMPEAWLTGLGGLMLAGMIWLYGYTLYGVRQGALA